MKLLRVAMSITLLQWQCELPFCHYIWGESAGKLLLARGVTESISRYALATNPNTVQYCNIKIIRAWAPIATSKQTNVLCLHFVGTQRVKTQCCRRWGDEAVRGHGARSADRDHQQTQHSQNPPGEHRYDHRPSYTYNHVNVWECCTRYYFVYPTLV